MKGYLLFAVALLLEGCVATSQPQEVIGHLYEYVRSNRDGSLPETILIYLPADDEVEVVKIVAPCTDAAYVTARIDPSVGSALRLVAGRLEKDGSQRRIGEMTYDPAERALQFTLGPDGGVAGRLTGVDQPWHLYDFDFASLMSEARFRWPVSDGIGFDLVRLMPTDSGDLKFEDLGRVEIAPQGVIDGEMPYKVDGAGLPEGTMARRIADGAIVSISSSERNHLEYDDFALRLSDDGPMSRQAWLERRQDHWRDCKSG